MKNSNELRAAIEAVEAEVRDIAAADETTEDQDARLDEAADELPALRAELAQAEKREALKAEVLAGRKTIPAEAPQVIKRDESRDIDLATASHSEVRDAAMRAIEKADRTYLGAIGDSRADALELAIGRGRTSNYDADRVARALVASSRPDYESAFLKGISGRSHELTPAESHALAEYRAQSLTGNEGGFGVPVVIDPTILITNGQSRNPLVAEARVEAITNDQWKGVSAAQSAWSMDAEGAEASDDSITFAQPTIATEKAQNYIPYSIEVGQDYPGWATEMGRAIAQGYTSLVASQLAVGTGVSPQTTGLFVGSTTTVDVGTDNTLAATDIDAVYAATPEDFRENGVWVMNVDVENEIRAFGSGTATSRFTVDQTAAGITLLNGKRVVLTDYAPAWTAADGQSVLVFGDMEHFVLAQRVGMTMELDNIVLGSNRRPTGQRALYCYARFGSGVVVANAFRRLKNITS